jgi:DNA-binding PadR family transcriptional regulator
MATRLLILGLLMEKDRHPYEIRQTIKARNWHHAFKVRDGSLYYAFDQMKQDGLIEVAETIPAPGENRPDKTVYTISEKGRDAFLERLYEKLGQESYPQHSMFVGLPFASYTDQAKLEGILLKQIKECEQRIVRIMGVLELKGNAIPRGALHLIQGILRFSETERDWLTDVLKDTQAGNMTSCGEHGETE